jgi:hypothetical protein
MIMDNKKLAMYLDSMINSVFKILPLYEEQNVGVAVYIESLIFELDGLQNVVAIEHSYEYISLLSILSSVKNEAEKSDSKKSIIKREVFKCINIIKNMVGKLKEGE